MPQPKDWLMDSKTRPLYMLSKTDPPQTKGHIQTENEEYDSFKYGRLKIQT